MKLLFLVVLEPSRILNTFTDPISFIWITNVHVFDGKRSTISLSKLILDHPQSYFPSHGSKLLEIPFVTTSCRPFKDELSIHILCFIKTLIC